MEFTPEEVLSAFQAAGSKGLKVKDLARRLGARTRDVKNLRAVVRSLESAGKIVRGRRQRYQLVHEAGYLKGRIVGYGCEAATFFPSDNSPGIKVSGENLFGAAHGDVVLARLVHSEERQTEAQVVRIVEKASRETIGQVSGWACEPGVGPYYGPTKRGVPPETGATGDRLVTVNHGPEEKRVTVGGTVSAKPGDYVVVNVQEWGEAYENAVGRVVRVLGGPSTPGEDFANLAKEFNLPLGFPPEVLSEVERIPDVIPREERLRREDLTGLLTFTIDPEDAKDFDDAISVEELGGDHFRIGVHIADVSHYVREGSALDHEALARGSSVYLVDRVIPMLPSRLSSDLAALRAGEDRLAVSIMMDVGRNGEVASCRIRESFIRSAARLNYEEAQDFLDRGIGLAAGPATEAIGEALKRADRVRNLLRNKRIGRGAIEIDTPEVQIVVDAQGITLDVRPVKRHESYNLIEELMILANESIADHMAYLGRLFIYRIHEVPDEEKMKDLALFAATFGHRFRWTKGTSPAALQSLLARVRGRPEEHIIAMFLLRSMKKAVYSERNVGHFGLASPCYTHFTSPIRRYPDLLVHRLLKRYGLKRQVPEDGDALRDFIHRAAEISSTREVESDEAERAFVKTKAAEFMEKHIGEEYWGVISGVKDFGIFVMLEENLIEGLVHVSCLGDDYYKLDSTGTMLVGSHGRSYYRMGDKVKVKVVRADRTCREVDFIVLAKEKREGKVVEFEEPLSRTRLRRMYKDLREEVGRGRSAGRRRGGPRPAHGRGEAGRQTRSTKAARLRRMRRVRRGARPR